MLTAGMLLVEFVFGEVAVWAGVVSPQQLNQPAVETWCVKGQAKDAQRRCHHSKQYLWQVYVFVEQSHRGSRCHVETGLIELRCKAALLPMSARVIRRLT